MKAVLDRTVLRNSIDIQPRWGAGDVCFILGVALGPSTSLRIGVVGPGETLLLGACVLWLLGGVGRPYIRFRLPGEDVVCWVAVLVGTIVGALVGSVVAPQELEVDGLFTWFFLAFVYLGAIASLSVRSPEEKMLLLKRMAVIATSIQGVLFLYALKSPYVLGYPLWYSGERYSGLADNPHQLATLLGPLIVIHSHFVYSSQGRTRYAHLILLFLAFAMGLRTQSSTLVAAVGITALTALYLAMRRISVERIWGTLANVLVLLTVVSLFGQVLDGGRAFLASDANGLGRIALWVDVSSLIDRSPIFGLGPGSHALGGTSEFHNSFLDLWAVGGVISVVAVTLLVGRGVTRILRGPGVLLCVLPLVVYSLAGFSARRLVFWAVLAICFSISRDLLRRDDSEGRGGGDDSTCLRSQR